MGTRPSRGLGSRGRPTGRAWPAGAPPLARPGEPGPGTCFRAGLRDWELPPVQHRNAATRMRCQAALGAFAGCSALTEAGAVSGHDELSRTAVRPRSLSAVHRSAAAGGGCLPGPVPGLLPATTPNSTCAATWPGARNAAWTRWPHADRTWNCTSAACKRSAISSPRRCPGAGLRFRIARAGLS